MPKRRRKTACERDSGTTGDPVTTIQSIGWSIGKFSEISAAVVSAVEQQRAATKESARDVQEATRCDRLPTIVRRVRFCQNSQ